MPEPAQTSRESGHTRSVWPVLSTRPRPRTRCILVVEDGPHDCFLLQRALKKFPKRTDLVHVFDGQEAIGWLSGTHTVPNLIITDLKMPGMNGFDLISWIKSSPAHSAIPIIVFSSSPLEVDQNRAKRTGAHAYFVKPSAYEDYEALILNICQEYIQ